MSSLIGVMKRRTNSIIRARECEKRRTKNENREHNRNKIDDNGIGNCCSFEYINMNEKKRKNVYKNSHNNNHNNNNVLPKNFC